MAIVESEPASGVYTTTTTKIRSWLPNCYKNILGEPINRCADRCIIRRLCRCAVLKFTLDKARLVSEIVYFHFLRDALHGECHEPLAGRIAGDHRCTPPRTHIYICAQNVHKYLLHCFVRHLQNEIRPERSQQSALHRFNIKSSIADYSYHILIYS